ncbi:MAG TPA: J domain-containing protein [Bacteroidia bacterium]
MSDHYSILGLTKSATTAEIKAAYRKLVKIYHPDKNPNNPEAVIKFRAIQEAYDVLSHSISRSKYDNGFSAAAYTYESPFSKTTQNKEQARTKRYTFTEEDLKRRQYYKEHYQQKPKSKVNSEEQKKAYNEIKYILVSVPITIALLFFIINVYKRGHPEETVKNTPRADSILKRAQAYVENQDKAIKDTAEVKEIVTTSDEPYAELFGAAKVDKRTEQVVQVTNWSNRDAVVCIVDAKTNKVVRHYFIADNFNLCFEYLPEGTYYLRNYLGKIGSFEKDRMMSQGSSVGRFTDNEQYQEFKKETFTIDVNEFDTITKNILLIKEDNSSAAKAGKKNLIDSTRFFGL